MTLCAGAPATAIGITTEGSAPVAGKHARYLKAFRPSSQDGQYQPWGPGTATLELQSPTSFAEKPMSPTSPGFIIRNDSFVAPTVAEPAEAAPVVSPRPSHKKKSRKLKGLKDEHGVKRALDLDSPDGRSVA